jgi:hypothetical protein
MNDAREQRIGEHAAANALPWAVNALGSVSQTRRAGWTGSGGPPRWDAVTTAALLDAARTSACAAQVVSPARTT